MIACVSDVVDGLNNVLFFSNCVIIVYFSKLTNQVIIVLVQCQNRLWVLYLDCTHVYLQFDMLVATVDVMNHGTCLFRTRSADDYGSSTKRHFSHLLPSVWSVVRQENEREDQGEGVQNSGKTSTDVRGRDMGVEEGTGKEIGGRRNENATMDVRSYEAGQDQK